MAQAPTSVDPKKNSGKMEGDKSWESLPGISKTKTGTKKGKPIAGGKGKNSAEVDAGAERVDQQGMKNMEGSTKVTGRIRNRRLTCGEQVQEVELQPNPPRVETASLESQVWYTGNLMEFMKLYN